MNHLARRTAFAALALAQVAHGAISDVQPVPSSLQVFADEQPAFSLTAQGVQRYECRALAAMPDRYTWAWVGPEAWLSDATGARVGKHLAGPSWEDSSGVRLTGIVKASAAAPRPGDLPWNLAGITAPAGGMFTGVSAIQQVDTQGGLQPENAPCDAATLGTRAEVPFAARFHFYRKKGA